MTHSNLELAKICEHAAKRITPEGAWTKMAYCRDVTGHISAIGDPEAACWCLEGAILEEMDPTEVDDAIQHNCGANWSRLQSAISRAGPFSRYKPLEARLVLINDTSIIRWPVLAALYKAAKNLRKDST